MTDPLDPNASEPRRRSMFTGLRNSFLTGLIVIAPIAFTAWLLWTVVGWIDSWVLPFVPDWFQPEQWIGINLRGVGLVIFLIFTVIVGGFGSGRPSRTTVRVAQKRFQQFA